MAYDQQILRGRATLLHAVHEHCQRVLIGRMRQYFARLTHGNPDDIVDLAHVRAVHRAERVQQMFGVVGGNRLRHPIQRVLGVGRAIVRMPGLLALFGQRVFDFAQIRSEFDRRPRLFADFTHRRMPMRLVLLELAFRPAPIVILRTVHDTYFNAVELFLRGFATGDRRIVRDIAARLPSPYDAAGGFHDASHLFAHIVLF